MKISKKDKKTIGSMAKKLPDMQHRTETERVTISGHELLKKGFTQIEGVPIVGHKLYLTNRKRFVNHKTELEKAFKLCGMDGVHAYVKGVYDAFKKPDINR